MLAYLEDYGFEHLSKQIEDNNLSGDMMTKLVFRLSGEFPREKCLCALFGNHDR